MPDVTEVQKPEKVELGTDSSGFPIHDKDLLLHVGGKALLHQITDSIQLIEDVKGLVLTEENAERIARKHFIPQKINSLNLTELLNKGPVYWDRVQRQIDRIHQQQSAEELTEEVEIESIVLPEDIIKIYSVKEIEDGIEIVFVESDGIKNRVFISNDIGTSVLNENFTGMWLTITDNDDNKELIISKPKIQNTPTETLKVHQLTRLSTAEQAFAKLKDDFPWITSEDLKNEYIQAFRANDSQMEFSGIDALRLRNLYPKPLRNLSVTSMPTEAEVTYLAIRNYCRAVELSTWYQELDNIDDIKMINIHQAAALKSPEERLKGVLEFASELESKTFELIKHRQSEEIRLFGRALRAERIKVDRYFSNDTIFPAQYLGLYYNGIFAINADVKSALVDNISNVKRGDRKKIIISNLVGTLSHETGHAELHPESEDKNTNKKINRSVWTHEEIWNEWYSCLFPNKLGNTEYSSKSLYGIDIRKLQNPTNVLYESNNDFSAIQNMIDELYKSSLEHPVNLMVNGIQVQLTLENIRRSALATASQRVASGNIKIDDKEIVSFPDLYNAVATAFQYNHTYEDQVAGLSDFDFKIYRLRFMSRETPQFTEENKRAINAFLKSYSMIVAESQ